jgi:ubiquinone biosynthesis protein UbiJ
MRAADEPDESIGGSHTDASVDERLDVLAHEVAAVRAEVAALRAAMERLNAKLSL